MAYITITGDSDGDLHTAAMHNSKFGAIASVINGNIGPDNLTNPNSELVYTCSAKNMLTASAAADNLLLTGYFTLGGTSNTGAYSNPTPVRTAGYWNVVSNSVIKVPATMTIKENVTIVIDDLTSAGGDFTSGDNLTFEIQKSNSPNNLTAWTTIGSAATHDCHNASFQQSIITLSGTANQSITGEHFIRLAVKNNSTSDAYPPTLVATIRLSAPHIT